jgi:putative sigma-54 modulation protein
MDDQGAKGRKRRPYPPQQADQYRFSGDQSDGILALKQETDMQINITGRHIEVTPALRAYVTEKLQRISRHFDHVISINVILRIEKNHQQQAEAKILAAGKSLFAQETNNDMYAAIDGLVDKLDRQVRRHKDRVRGHHASAAKRAASAG